MRVYTITEESPYGQWPRSFAIDFHEHSIPDSAELSRWCHRVFKGHWMLAMRSEQIVSGHMDFAYRPVTFHLRCHDDDAECFLAAWRISDKEYQKNMDYILKRENQKQGWFEINGEKLSINEISQRLMDLPPREGELPTTKQILARLPDDLWKLTGDDWVMIVHHIVTEPVCPTVTIRPEWSSTGYTCFGDTVEEALAHAVQCVIDARKANTLPIKASEDGQLGHDA